MRIRRWMRNVLLLAFLLTATYAYQFPLKSYVAEQQLYDWLATTQGVQRSEVEILGSYKDLKVGRNRYNVFFTVEDSPFDYEYVYSFKERRWIDQRVNDGQYRIPTNEIIYTNKQLEEIR